MYAGVGILQLVVITCIVTVWAIHVEAGDGFFHQAPDQYKLQPGWQEPGLWRPRWVLDREFDVEDEQEEEVEEEGISKSKSAEELITGGAKGLAARFFKISKVGSSSTSEESDADNDSSKMKRQKKKKNLQPRRDRVYLRLKSDRTVKVFKGSNRPLLEIFKKKEKAEKKKNLFESGNEEMASFEDQINAGAAKLEESFYDLDGTWWFQDAAPLPQGKIKIETREGGGKKGQETYKLRHDARCDWGTLDGYAAMFRSAGKIVKYKMGLDSLGMPLPIGEKVVGRFTLRVSPHRPIVSKDYIAFQ